MDYGAILGGLAAVCTALLGGLAALSSSRSRRATRDVEHLTERVDRLVDEVAGLQMWQLAARLYIATLRGALADRGITAPDPPIELGLSAPLPPSRKDKR